MIKHFRHASREELHADVCIVGGGVAGIALALELEPHGARVLVLEGGGRRIEPEQQELYEGTIRGLPARPLTESRFRCLGGSSSRWFGRCVQLEPLDLEQRDWIAGSGWPITAEHLAPYYRRAAQLLGIRRPRTGDPELNSAATLELGSSRLAVRWGDIRATHVGRRYRRRLAASGSLTVLLGAQVLQLDTERGSRISSLCVASLDGARRRVTASVIVLAAGGIENPRLMLLSGLDREWPSDDCPVGRYFMDHAYLESARIFDYAPILRRDFTLDSDLRWLGHLTLRAEVLRSERLSACAAYLLPGFAYLDSEEFWRHPLRDLKQSLVRREMGSAARRLIPALRSLPRSARLLARRVLERSRPPASLIFRCVLEQVPNSENRVRLGSAVDRFGLARPEVAWTMAAQDTRSLHRFHEIASHEIELLGLGRCEPRFDFRDDSWQRHISSGRHHMGATRMGNDPATSVVDAHCRVHSVDNLFVAGSSAFPTYGWANPTLTIVALALRLADHLAGRGDDQRLEPGE